MANLCHLRSQPLMETPEFSKILFLLIGHLAKLSLAASNSNQPHSQIRAYVLNLDSTNFHIIIIITRTAEACFFILLLEQPATPLLDGGFFFIFNILKSSQMNVWIDNSKRIVCISGLTNLDTYLLD